MQHSIYILAPDLDPHPHPHPGHGPDPALQGVPESAARLGAAGAYILALVLKCLGQSYRCPWAPNLAPAAGSPNLAPAAGSPSAGMLRP